MSRTFSLWGLMAGVTSVCVLVALAVNFPGFALIVALIVGYFIPTIVVCGVLPWFSSRPTLTVNVAFLGAIVGFLIAPPIHAISGGTREFWDLYARELEFKALPAALGAFFAGFACVGFFPRWVKREIDGE